ncbi:hypothetical protein [Blastomonas natatoria]|uniref:hypothetical protein n=1 Tax=Blastomonas natatoria TaxID=34015 RepID=UPI001FC951A4|nr:hypothetical protein [Blastomonas natatoria]
MANTNMPASEIAALIQCQLCSCFTQNCLADRFFRFGMSRRGDAAARAKFAGDACSLRFVSAFSASPAAAPLTEAPFADGLDCCNDTVVSRRLDGLNDTLKLRICASSQPLSNVLLRMIIN